MESSAIYSVNINELKPRPNNRNSHPQEQIDRLIKIIEYQGFRRPIIVSNLSGFVVCGHGRLEAAKKMGMAEVPVIYQDYASDEQEYADHVADNSLQSWAELDLSGINTDLADLGPDFDLDMLGIKDFVLEPAEKVPMADEDAVPEHVDTRVKLGDVWTLGEHRLLCGDSTSIDAVDALMAGEKADMVFTDPPYGYEYESNHQSTHAQLKNDDKVLDFMPCAYSAMASDSSIFVCGSHQTICKWRPLIDQQFTYKNLIVWKKNNWSMGDLKGAFAGQHELIFYAVKGRVELRGDRSRDVWEFDRDPPKSHPTQKPIDLIEFAISKVSDSGASVLDLFGGSGSTLIACEKTNRKCFMMEIDPHYCSVILKRWEDYTGKKAELENGQASVVGD